MDTPKLLSTCICFVLLFSCKNSTSPSVSEAGNSSTKNEKQASIGELEKKIHGARVLNAAVGHAAIRQYMSYAASYPEDSISAYYLFKAGEIATTLKQYPDAMKCYQTICTSYPSFVHARESLYLQGYVLDNFLNDDVKAKEVYEQFLSKYTYGNYVEDAKAAIANLENR